MNELLFIVNPVAGHGRSLRVFARLRAVLERVPGVRCVVWHTRGPGHARELAERAALEGYGRILAVGGDGTVHEALNGLMALSPAARGQIAFGVVPAGSGNDFARNTGIPRDAAALATLLASGPASPMDVGVVNGHYFANVAGVGFDAEVARQANRLPKFVPGALTYVFAALWTLSRYRNAAVRIVLDGETLERRVMLVAVGNGAGYGGGMRICPGARMDDGTFRVVVAGDLPKPSVLSLLPKVFSGRHVEHPLVEVYDARHVRIEAERPLAVQADGEIVAASPLSLEVVPSAVRVIGLLGRSSDATSRDHAATAWEPRCAHEPPTAGTSPAPGAGPAVGRPVADPHQDGRVDTGRRVDIA